MPSLAAATSAADVRRAIVAGLRGERKALEAVPLAKIAKPVAALVDRAVATAAGDRGYLTPDANGVTMLEVSVMRGASDLLMRAYWPHVARAWAAGRGKPVMNVQGVDALDYADLVALYDSISQRLVRETIHNDAWRIAGAALQAARVATRG